VPNDDCPKHFQSAFSIAEWRSTICQQGYTNDYDQTTYDKYLKRVKSIRAAMVVVPLIIASITAVIIGLIADDGGCGGFMAGAITFFALLAILYLAILPPVFTAI
jgi:hypothetical protein